jgi:hypothetical protein
MSLSNEESLYLFMDGELDASLEESLFSELAYNTELRNEMKDLLFMRNAVKRDEVAPPLFVKDRLITAVGLATATLGAGSGAGTIAVSEFANGAMQWWNALWFKVAIPVVASLVGAGAMWVYDKSDNNNANRENGNSRYASESALSTQNPDAPSAESNSNTQLSELRTRIAENERTISALQSEITKAKQQLASAERVHSVERQRLMNANTELYAKSVNAQSTQSKNSTVGNTSIHQTELANKEQERKELERSYRLAQEQNAESAKEIERLTMNIRNLETKLAQVRTEQATSVASQNKQASVPTPSGSTVTSATDKPISTYQQSVAQELQSQKTQQANTAMSSSNNGQTFVSAQKGQTHIRLRGINSQSITETSLQPQSSSIFDNSYIATMYQISGGLSAGVEVGRESFAQVYHGRISERLTYVEQYPQLWNVNVILNYRLAEFNVLGPTQLYGETSIGGAVYGGAIVRQSLGLRYDIGNGLSILTSAQAGGMWFQFQNNFFPSYKYGFTYGIQYSFF